MRVLKGDAQYTWMNMETSDPVFTIPFTTLRRDSGFFFQGIYNIISVEGCSARQLFFKNEDNGTVLEMSTKKKLEASWKRFADGMSALYSRGSKNISQQNWPVDKCFYL